MLEPITLDLDGLRRNLLRRGTPDRVYYFEHGDSNEFKDALARRFALGAALNPAAPTFAWQREIAIQRYLGREIFRVWLPGSEFALAGSKGHAWAEEHTGPIQSWEDLERYPWPDPAAVDYSQLEWYERHLPEDMGVFQVVKVWEVVRELLGFETYCTMLYEDLDLVLEVTRRVGEFHRALAHSLCGFRCVFAVYGADDYGYKTATMMRPEVIREQFLPWHQAMAAEAHAHGKLYFMHSCGQISALMDTLIDEVRIDAKHSFEDIIEPVAVAKARWGGRVALLGGLDVDFIARRGEADIRRRVRETLDACFTGGGYCLGLGNWVTSYIPMESYLAVLDEGRRYT